MRGPGSLTGWGAEPQWQLSGREGEAAAECQEVQVAAGISDGGALVSLLAPQAVRP